MHAERPAHLAVATPEEILRNYSRLSGPSQRLQDIEAFLPELRGLGDREVLSFVGERYLADPTPRNAGLVQFAVNRITTRGPVPGELRDVIDSVTGLLHESGASPDVATDDLWCWSYVDANYNGASMFLDLPSGWIYWAESYVGDAMNDKISSMVGTCTSNEVGGNFCLFENARFWGHYLNFHVDVPPGTNGWVSDDVSYVGDSFNDITSSILLVRRFANETRPTQLSALVHQSDINSIVNAQSQVSSAGNATFTWDMWPTGPTSGSDWHPNDPSKAFLYVIIPINVDTGTIFGTYSCQIRYWIYLYVDGHGNIQGYVDYYGCWVQGGWITGQVQSSLMSKIPGTIGEVDSRISNALTFVNLGGPYRLCYYLPGKNTETGSTWDDVTIVLAK